jgi:enoyl-CoA hydratase
MSPRVTIRRRLIAATRRCSQAVRASMAALEQVTAADDEEGWAATAAAVERARASADAREGVQAFPEKRPPVWSGQ